MLSGDDYTRNYIIKNSVNTDTDISVYATDITLSATQFKNLLLEDAKNYSDLTIKNLRINDTQNEIQSLFSSIDTKLIAGLRQVSSFTSTTDNTVIKLDWNNLSQIAGTTSIGQFIKKVGVDSLVVSGTAGELQQIFSQFGVDFTDLPVGVEFKITDGGEVKLSTSELEKLDGRITGAVIVDELTSSYFDKNVSSNVKDVEVGAKDLFLTVDQFRNAPDYLDKTGDLFIKDTAANIKDALDYSVIDGRVDGIVVKDATSLNLNVVQAQKLNDTAIKGKTTTDALDFAKYSDLTELSVVDRPSALVEMIESGDFPANKVSLKSSADSTIALDYRQTEALKQLIDASKVDGAKSNISDSGSSLSLVSSTDTDGKWTFQTKDLFTRLTEWVTNNVVNDQCQRSQNRHDRWNR